MPGLKYMSHSTEISIDLIEHFVKRLGLGDMLINAVHLSVSW